MDSQKRKKELANDAFTRRELGPLLRMFSSLGITLTLGIICSYLLGRYLNRSLSDAGLQTYGLPGIAITLSGIVLSLCWCYLRIGSYIEKYVPQDDKPGKEGTKHP